MGERVSGSTRLARKLSLFLAGFILSCFLGQWSGLNRPTIAQTATPASSFTVENVAAANFQDATGATRPVESNTTLFTAAVQQSALELVKTGDRSAAEPGDSVVYRLLVRNVGTVPVTDFAIEDDLPRGLRYVEDSVRGGIGSQTAATPITIDNPVQNEGQIRFQIAQPLEPNQTLSLAYAALLTPDAIRGDGRNLAVALGRSGGQDIRSNTASHRLLIRPGILSDCGTIIGRVFVDKNYDGEQQPGEPGVPNAVIFMDDGNRVATDPDGLFSLANVIAGNRSGALDLTSLPGYTLAPNLYRIEANSQSRLVRLQPGGLVRMNFAVTPAFGEGQQ